MKTEEFWDKCLQRVEEKVGQSVFDLWFKPARLASYQDGEIIIEVPNRFFKEWIRDYHPGMLEEIINELTGETPKVTYRVEEQPAADVKRMETRLQNRQAKMAGRGIHINPKYTFSNFVTGPSNQFAAAAAAAVAEAPGSTYNPLFVYGGVGLGKTHLMNAVGNKVFDMQPDLRILYVSSEQFTSEVVFAFRHDKTNKLKEKYRNLDLLLMDDVQLIENKTATQEELFHTMNALYEQQKQIILSSDRPPREIVSITDRLRSRFSMGLIADIQPPEVETKIAIIQKKAETERLRLPEDVIMYIATKVKSNIRDLEGCLIRLGAHASITGSSIDLPTARSVLKDILRDDDRPLNVETISKTVAEYFGIKVSDMKLKKRTKEISTPRQIAMYISRELTDASLSEIGKQIGGKDHATVIYSCKQVEARRSKDEAYDRMIEGLVRKLRP